MPGTKTQWALVTGASGGLGSELARGLAERGYALALTARSEEALARQADALRRAHGVEVVTEAVDLGAPGGATRLQQQLAARQIEPQVLVNNAGFGLSAPFLDHDPARLRSMLELNILSLTELTQAFGRRMAARGEGRILLVASLAAHQPAPLLAAYGASKAYVLSLGEALNVELGPKVGVTVLSPGLMDTGFNAASGFETPAAMQRFVLPTARVARIGLDALFAGKPSVIVGRANAVMAFSNRFISRHLAAKLSMSMSAGAKTHA